MRDGEGSIELVNALRKKVREAEREAAVELHSKGHTVRAIRRALHLRNATVSAYLRPPRLVTELPMFLAFCLAAASRQEPSPPG